MSRKQWNAGVIVALSLAIALWVYWPVQAGSSIELNTTDRMSENFHFVTSPDDAAVDITDVMMSGFVFDDVSTDTVNEGDSGYARMSADRRILVDADITGPAGAAALALDTSVDGLEGLVEDIRNLARNEAIAATGETLDLDLSDVDTVTGLTAGATYMVVSIDGIGLFGIASAGAGGTGTPANVLWTVTAGNTRYITMPAGQTVLHYTARSEDVTAYFSQVVND